MYYSILLSSFTQGELEFPFFLFHVLSPYDLYDDDEGNGKRNNRERRRRIKFLHPSGIIAGNRFRYRGKTKANEHREIHSFLTLLSVEMCAGKEVTSNDNKTEGKEKCRCVMHPSNQYLHKNFNLPHGHLCTKSARSTNKFADLPGPAVRSIHRGKALEKYKLLRTPLLLFPPCIKDRQKADQIAPAEQAVQDFQAARAAQADPDPKLLFLPAPFRYGDERKASLPLRTWTPYFS